MINRRFFEEVFVAEIYKPVRKLGNIHTVIDLGATTGEFSLWVHQQAQIIYAIEPTKEYFKYLKENVRDFPKIKPFFLAVDETNGTVRIYGSDGGERIVVGNSDFFRNKVTAKTLATFMKENNIEQVDVLKIDVEDRETEIFRAEDFPEVASKIKFIIGEHLTSSGGKLEELGFRVKDYEYGIIAKRNA